MWTMVVQSSDASDPAQQQRLMNLLCRSYWGPLCQYAKRLGNSQQNAEDLTQGFFARLIVERDDGKQGLFSKAQKEKGRLRTLLLTAFNHHIHNEHDRATALKRGGKEAILSLDLLAQTGNDEVFENEEAHTPESMFQKRCALKMLSAAEASLEEFYKNQGKKHVYDSLRPFLNTLGDAESYAVEAARLQVEVGNYRVMVQRFRVKFKETLREHVRETLPDDATPEDVRKEILDIIALAYS
jgi:RNA polymerase sigma-70 factor (ECF subfamily)